MILIYCQGVHPKAEKRHTVMDMGKKLLCDECITLYKYSQKRLTYCRFGEAKTTCANCPVHCYAPQEREEIKRVMRYAGARMLFKHPWLAFRHVIDGRTRRSS
ncbi:nitrous oxide-stimulated promoter family protein [Paenibacillus sp. YSY-4.3]